MNRTRSPRLSPAPRQPRVLMVSTSYPANLADWRGLFIRHLAFALARRDDLRLSLWAPPGERPDNVDYAADTTESRWLSDLMAAGGIAHAYRTGGIRGVLSPLRLLWSLRTMYRRSPADIYHVNWLQNALALPPNGRPLLTSVLGTDMQLLRLPMMRTLLRRAFRSRAVTICPNAEWMTSALTQAFGDVASIRYVPFGIAPGWFGVKRELPADGEESWLCVSRLTQAKIGTLFEWCEPHFLHSRRTLHLFGPMQQELQLPDWVCYHGPATPDALQREWFPRAHGLITLSQHAEGRPQVILEAMAAGLPIIASALPAHADVIQDGQSGFICDDASAVTRALEILGDVEVNSRIGASGREWVAAEIGTWDDCARRYAALYDDLLDRRCP